MSTSLLLSLVFAISPVESAFWSSSEEVALIAQGTLELRVPVAHRRFEPDTAHVWDLVLEANNFAEVRVLQQGVDVVLVVLDPNGEVEVESDLPLGSGAFGTERAVWVADRAGAWKIEVRPYGDAPVGEYAVEWKTARAASEIERGLVEAQAATILAVAQHEKRLYEQAEASYQRALSTLEDLLDADDVSVATSLNLLASFYEKGLRRYDDSKKLYLRALAIQEQSLDRHHPDVVVTATSLAGLYRAEGLAREREGGYEEAQALYERAYDLDSTYLGPDDPDLAIDYSNVARLHRTQGRYAEAERLYQRARDLYDKPGFEGHLGAILNNLGALKRDQGKYGEAASLFRRALELLERTMGPAHRDVAASLNNLGAALRAQGQYAEAEKYYLRALELRRETLGRSHLDVAGSLNNLAVLYRDLGKDTEAKALYEEALAIQENTLGDHPALAHTLYNLARSKVAMRDSSAIESIQRAIELLDETHAFPGLRVHAYALRAKLVYESGNLNDALSDLEEAIRSAEALRPQIGGGEETRADFFERFSDYFDRMVSWLIEAGREDEALEYAERGRARVLLDQLSAGRVDLRSKIPTDIREELEERERRARRSLSEHQQQLNELRSRKDLTDVERTARVTELRDKMRAAEREYQQVYADIKNASPLWRDLISDKGAPVSVSSIQRSLLPKDGLLLLYQVGMEKSHLFVVARRGRVRAFSLELSEEVASALDTEKGPLTSLKLDSIVSGAAGLGLMLSQTSRGLGLSESGDAGGLTERLHALWRILVPESLWAEICQSPQVVLVPDGVLHGLPFEALVVKPAGESGEAVYWLDEGPAILYAASATTLYNIQNRPDARVLSPSHQVLSLADPIYDQSQVASRIVTEDPAGAPRLALSTLSSGTRSTVGWESRELPRLPGTSRETEALREVFASSASADFVSLTQLDANEAELRTTLPGKRYVHLATHGLLGEEGRSLFSALALTPPDDVTPSGENDGFLQLHEIYALELGECELAVLSACETNLGRSVEGEGVFALSRGFLAAGARRVVASQWSVDDASTAELMADFFRRIVDQEAAGERIDFVLALRDAKRAIRGQPRWTNPFFWAPFILTGKP